MFETIIAYLLSRLLGHYFENIRTENIKFSLSGELVLKNLIIKVHITLLIIFENSLYLLNGV
jgi:hypothetical protein